MRRLGFLAMAMQYQHQSQHVMDAIDNSADQFGSFVLPLSIAGLAVVGLFSLPGAVALLSQIRNRTPRDNFYSDVDGTSTPEAVAAFSNKRAKIAILLFSLTSFGTSVAHSVLATLHADRYGLFVPSWLITAALVSLPAPTNHDIISSIISANEPALTPERLPLCYKLSSSLLTGRPSNPTTSAFGRLHHHSSPS